MKASRAARGAPMQLQNDSDAVAHAEGFAGKDLGDEIQLERAYGSPTTGTGSRTSATQFAIASGSKGLTGLMITSLIEEGVLKFETKARLVA